MSPDEHERAGHAVGDARKRLLEHANNDEQHAHLPEPDVVLGEE